MSDLQAIADRVEIEALRGEFTDAGMMRDYDRLASLFTHDAVWRIPAVNAEFAGREEIRDRAGLRPPTGDQAADPAAQRAFDTQLQLMEARVGRLQGAFDGQVA